MDGHSSIHEARLLIDTETADRTVQTQELKTGRNQLALVSKLPDEVILQIFIILRDFFLLHPQNWLQATQVCRRWRDIGVGSPLLWTRLYNPPPALTPLMLERSKDAPLEVSISGSKKKPKVPTATFVTIMRQIGRIQTLAIEEMPVEILETVDGVLQQLGEDRVASLLETLTVDVEIGMEDPRSFNVFRLTRSLRKFSVWGGHYFWSMLPLPALNGVTSLYLFGEHRGEVPIAQFLETLSHMHRLESLGFIWDRMDLCYPPSTTLSSSRPVELPCLRELEILEGHQPDLELFFALVKYSKLHRLSVYPEYADPVPFTKSILSSASKGNFEPLGCLIIEPEDITIYTKPRLSYYPEGSHIHMSVSSHFDEHYKGFDFVMDIMSCVTPLDAPDKIPLRHIALDNWDAPMDDFVRTFASLPHLEAMEVYEKLGLVLFKAMNTSSGAPPGTPVPFCTLRKVIWHGRPKQHSDRQPATKISASAFGDIVNGLLSRRACGAPAIRLELVGCEAFEDVQIGQLRETGVELIIRKNQGCGVYLLGGLGNIHGISRVVAAWASSERVKTTF